MTHQTLLPTLLLLACAASLPAPAQTVAPPVPSPESSPASASTAGAPEQVIVPQVERRDVRPARYPSNDFSISLFGGVYQAQNFGSSGAAGLRLGYHITEDVFVEASLGRSRVSDSSFRQILPGGVFPTPTQSLSYYDVVAGYNVLTGEAFFGRNNARATQGYVVAGVGNSTLVQQKHQTLVLGLGMRVIVNDRFAVQTDLREHIFTLDLLGQRQSTRNPELGVGLTLFF